MFYFPYNFNLIQSLFFKYKTHIKKTNNNNKRCSQGWDSSQKAIGFLRYRKATKSFTFPLIDLKGLQMHAHLGVIPQLVRGFKRKTQFEEWSWRFWLLTFLVKINKTPIAKMWYLPRRQLFHVSLHEPWHPSGKRVLRTFVLWLLKS